LIKAIKLTVVEFSKSLVVPGQEQVNDLVGRAVDAESNRQYDDAADYFGIAGVVASKRKPMLYRAEELVQASVRCLDIAHESKRRPEKKFKTGYLRYLATKIGYII